MSDDWADVLGALAETGARFLVVGAHAMAVHGVPRGTQDLDVWIDPAVENAERVWRSLAVFGAPLQPPWTASAWSMSRGSVRPRAVYLGAGKTENGVEKQHTS